MENLNRGASLGSGVKSAEFGPFFLEKLKSPATKMYGGGDTCCGATLCRPPRFVWTMITQGGEFGYKFFCKTISNYVIILVTSSCVN